MPDSGLLRLLVMHSKMLQMLSSRCGTVKCMFVVTIFVLMSVILLFSSTQIGNVRVHRIADSCAQCSLSSLSFHDCTKIVHLCAKKSSKNATDYIDLVIFFTHADRNPGLKKKLTVCLSTLVKYASSSLHIHILTDDSSLENAVPIIRETLSDAHVPVQISFYDVTALLDPLKGLIELVRPHFSYKLGAYYSDALFFLSIGLFKVIPLEKVIIIDVDVKFLNDIKHLHRYFEKFSRTALIGIAQEQQPVYRHVLHEYRQFNNKSWIGGPPPHGFPGFNSGVLLMDLQRMKASKLYEGLLNNSTLHHLVAKYKFKGHLGDQDFYTLISFDHPELFYTLPCTWNRQLCQWWRHHGYAEVFDSYHFCNSTVNLLHGNCNSLIPEDLY